MGRLFSLLQTITCLFTTAFQFLSVEGAKSMGLERFRGFGKGGRKASSGGTLDNPFDPKSKKRGFLDAAPREGKISGHSLGNFACGAGNGGEPVVDYTKLSAKADYMSGLTSNAKAAAISGFDDNARGRVPKEKLSSAPKLLRGEKTATRQMQKPIEFKPVTALNRPYIQGKTIQPMQTTSSNHMPRSTPKKGDGPGGMSHTSVRNFIKFSGKK